LTTLVFRFAGAPQKIDFLLDGMNIVDLLAVLPFYVSLFLAPPSTPVLPLSFDEFASSTESHAASSHPTYEDVSSTTASSSAKVGLACAKIVGLIEC
jgi:hypothetical protein